MWCKILIQGVISTALAVAVGVGWYSYASYCYRREHRIQEKHQQLVRYQRHLLHQLEQIQVYLEDPRGLAAWRRDDGKVCYIQDSTFPPAGDVPRPLDGKRWRQAVGRLLSTILVPITAQDERLEGTAERNVYLECPRGCFRLADVPAERVFVADQQSGELCLEILMTSEHVFSHFAPPQPGTQEGGAESVSNVKIRQAVDDYVQTLEVFGWQKGPMRAESLSVAAIAAGACFALGCFVGPLRMVRKRRREDPDSRDEQTQST